MLKSELPKADLPQNKEPRLRIVINIGMYGATQKYCGNCRFLNEGKCRIFDMELNWNKSSLQFKRCDECEFDTIQDKRR